jgi:hypothetical protein
VDLMLGHLVPLEWECKVLLIGRLIKEAAKK